MKPNFQSGVTLIEVIVSMFLVFVLFVLYLAAMNTVVIIKKTNYSDIAYHVANKQMEAVRSTPYASLTIGTTSISDPDLSRIPSGAGNYVISNYSSMTGVYEVVVTVSWNDGGAKSIVLQTLMGSGGINP